MIKYSILLLCILMPACIIHAKTPTYYLTLWQTNIHNQHPYGTWDYNSLPDPVIDIYHHETVIMTLPKQKDQLTPQWNVTVAAFDQESLAESAVELYIYDQDFLDKELIESLQVPMPRKEIIGKNIVLKGAFVTVYLQWQYSINDQVIDLSDETISHHSYPHWIPPRKVQKKTIEVTSSDASIKSNILDDSPIAKSLQSKQLFQKYLKAYFEGDQLYAHQILLQKPYCGA